MATHFNIPVWKSSWTEEPGGLQSLGSGRKEPGTAEHAQLHIYKGAWAFQVALVVKNLPANAGHIRDVGLIPGLRRSPGGGHSNPLQYSCLENLMDRGAWRATAHSVTKSRTQLK